MIGVRLSGGLGNQMFQFAFIYALAKKNNTSFFLDKEGQTIELYEYFELDKNLFYLIDIIFFNTNKFKLVFSHYLRNFFYKTLQHIAIKKSVKIDFLDKNILNKKSVDSILFSGYFQSEKYFKGYETDIINIFKIKKRYVEDYQQKFKNFNRKKIVAVHIRKTDYAELGHLGLGDEDLSLPIQYFKYIIAKVHSDENYYVFVSDDIKLIRPEFADLQNAHFSDDSAIIDFMHLYYANTVIIANSTFSWWAAYLNRQTDKKVYCPKYFLGFHIKQEYPANIYPPDWHQIDPNLEN